MNPGVEIGNWITTNVGGLFGGILAVLGIIIVVKRKILFGVVLIIVGGLGAVLIYGGPEFAQKISDIVISWFN